MYTLVLAGVCSMQDLKEVCTLDEALTLYALYIYRTDMERCMSEDAEQEARNNSARHSGGARRR